MPYLTREQQVRFDTYIAQQEVLLTTLPTQFAIMKKLVQKEPYIELKSLISSQLKEQLSTLMPGQKLAIGLIDIQIGFTIKGGAAYVKDGEQVVLWNMAYLQAVKELFVADWRYKERIIIISSQDTHRIGRAKEEPDSLDFAKAYGDDLAASLIEAEQRQLKAPNMPEGSWDIHCHVGTPDAALAEPINELLQDFENDPSVQIFRFGKLLYSAFKSALKLCPGVDLSDASLLSGKRSIYDPSHLTYQQLIAALCENGLALFIGSGICANCCEQALLEDLKAAYPKLRIATFDAGSHFALFDALNYDENRNKLEDSYRAKGIDVISTPGWRSNLAESSKLYPI